MRLFQFSIRDQASNWLERLPAGSISTWEDLTTRFVAQFFPPERTAKLRNDILMFQQHQGESLSEAWTHVPSTSDRRLIKLEHQVQRLMEAYISPIQPTQVNKITSLCEICSGPHDTQYCMENPEQAFVEYASSRTDEAGETFQPTYLSSSCISLKITSILHYVGLPYANAPAGRPLGTYDLGVATPRALVYAGMMTSGDAKSWYMISEDAKSWGEVNDHLRIVVLRFGWTLVCAFGFIMPPRMTTRSAGRATTAPRGGRTGRRTGRGGGRTRGRSGDQGNGRIDGQGGQVGSQGGQVGGQAQVGNQGRNQRNGRNQNSDAVNDNIWGNVRNVIENNDCRGCTYKEFLACNPKEYDGKGGAIVYTRWIKKMESVQDMSGCMSWEDFKTLTKEEFCLSNEMQKLETELWNHAMVGASHAAYTDRFHELASKDRNGRDDNKRTRIRNAFATTINPVRRENTRTASKCTTCNFYHPPEAPCHTCFNCIRLGYLAKDCRVVPRNVNPVNARNPTAACGACYECEGCGNNGNQARGRAFMLGAEEAHRDPSIVTGTFTLNNHYATTLFESSADYSFVSTTFIPLLGIEPSDLGFSYEIEISSEQLVEIDKVIKGCNLEIEGRVFDINLIPFRS
ncbi:putative reverse transcriptase domain-containing protein [Tanacetum coccineum]